MIGKKELNRRYQQIYQGKRAIEPIREKIGYQEENLRNKTVYFPFFLSDFIPKSGQFINPYLVFQ